MNKTSWIFRFMCNRPIRNLILNIKYHSYDEIIENIWIGAPITHIMIKPEFATDKYWLIVF